MKIREYVQNIKFMRIFNWLRQVLNECPTLRAGSWKEYRIWNQATYTIFSKLLKVSELQFYKAQM